MGLVPGGEAPVTLTSGTDGSGFGWVSWCLASTAAQVDEPDDRLGVVNLRADWCAEGVAPALAVGAGWIG